MQPLTKKQVLKLALASSHHAPTKLHPTPLHQTPPTQSPALEAPWKCLNKTCPSWSNSVGRVVFYDPTYRATAHEAAPTANQGQN